MLATAAAVLLAFAPGDAPVRFAPPARQLVAAPVIFAPLANLLAAQGPHSSDAIDLMPLWGGFATSLVIDGAVVGGYMLADSSSIQVLALTILGLGAVELVLKPFLIALAEGIIAKDWGLLWTASAAAFLGNLVGAVLFVVAASSWSRDNGTDRAWLIASGAAFVLAVPGLTAIPLALRDSAPAALRMRWSF